MSNHKFLYLGELYFQYRYYYRKDYAAIIYSLSIERVYGACLHDVVVNHRFWSMYISIL